MKTSGIARKIDRLGRIVIPKEIRSALRIASGDYVDMYVESSAIVIRKTEVLGRYADIAEAYVQTIYQKTGTACFICSRDSVIASRAAVLKTGHEISNQLRAVIIKGDAYYSETAPFINLDSTERQLGMQCVIPLNCGGEVHGAIVVYSLKNQPLDSECKSFLTNAGELLCAQMMQG